MTAIQADGKPYHIMFMPCSNWIKYIIGKGGAMLKKIASAARTDCEEFLGCRVNLQCWVKVKADWRDNEFMLNNFGFKQQPSR